MEDDQQPRRVRAALASFWRGRDIGLVYGVIVVVASLWVNLHPYPQTRALVQMVSTNLANMRSHPLSVLAASAFVVSPLSQLLLVPVVVLVFGLVQRWLGRIALLAVWVFGHVGATLFVMSMEITALYRHIARFSITVKPDVGVSYGLAAAVGLLAARVPRRRRWAYALGCLAVTGGMMAVWPDFTSLGHLTAVLIGLGMAAAVHGGERTVRRRLARSADARPRPTGVPADASEPASEPSRNLGA